MIFEDISGTSSGFDADSITDTTKSSIEDYYKDWDIKISGLDFVIDSNTATKFFFKNTLSSNESYVIKIVSRATLIKYDQTLSSQIKFPDSLINAKLELVKREFINILEAQYREKFNYYDDPLSKIYNLGKLKIPFTYLTLSKLYEDISVTDSDIAWDRASYFYKLYKNTLNDALSLLAFDSDGSGSLTGSERANSQAKINYFTR